MPGKIYNWPRFWHAPGELHLDSHGFLVDPLSDYGKYLGAKSLDDVSGMACLVLLGEPGMGKTHAMTAAREKVSAPSLAVELGKQATIDELSKRLFKAPTFRRWRKDGDVLHLFLDALDEGLLLIETVHHFLVAELRDLPRADLRRRLKLRISCRTADWPASFGEQLKELWGQESFGIFHLAPLRRVDVQEAASQDGLAPESFLAEVIEREVGPLAARPVTVKMLLDIYGQEQALPESQIDLYERGCLRLCEDPNQDRRERRRTGELEAPERLEIASRIAALMVFGNRSLIQPDSLKDIGEGEISIRDLAGREEPVRGNALAVGEGAISDVLRHTALFVGAGGGLLAWAHQTYSEFLAARYLVHRGVDPEKILSLITHPEDPERKLAPQLHEAAAWLAGLSCEVFTGILAREPEVLLRSDVTGVTSESRARLAGELLRRVDSGEIVLHWDTAKDFHKLNHPALAGQLKPYIADRQRRREAREAAIAVAERAGCQEVAPDLLELALSPDEPEGLRADAISALGEIADGDLKAKLRILVVDQAAATSQFLKSRALRVLWPSHLSSEELFSVLGAARSKEDLRHYQSFLAGDFAKDLEGASVVPALRWIGEIGELRRAARSSLEKAVQGIMKSAWQSFDEPEVVEAFARMLIDLAERHVRIDFGEVSSLIRTDIERRRRLLVCLFDAFAGSEEVSYWVFAWPWRPLDEDTFWLLERLDEASGQASRELLARLVAGTYDRANRRQVRAVTAAAKRYPVLQSILLESTRQRRKLRQFERQHEVAITKEAAAKAQLLAEVGRPIDKVRSLLRDFEGGDLEAWWKIDYWLRIADDLEHELSERSGDLSSAPGWPADDGVTRERLINGARLYVLSGDPHTETWIDPEPKTSYRIPLAAYRAFRLLLLELEAIQPASWKKWAPALLHFLAQGGSDDQKTRDVLLENLTRHAPDEVYAGLERTLDRKSAAGESLIFLQSFESILDRRLLELIWRHFPEREPLTETGTFLLRLLLRNDFDPVQEYASGIVRRWSETESGEGEAEALTMVRSLVAEGKGCGWDVVWPACLQKPEFGRKLWLSLGEERAYGGLREFQRLPPDQLEELIRWLWDQFPITEISTNEDGLTERDELEFLRGRIITHLVNSGTTEACSVLENLSRARPELIGLRYSLFNARQNLRLKSYPWPAPGQVLKLALDAKVRVVRTESDLLDIVLEALRGLQREFQQETPAAIDVWNEWGERTKEFRPKSENQISDYVKRYLDRVLPGYGVIVNRETENRPRVGKQGEPGERTDILVNVRVPETQEELTVIVEAKGCWNDELFTAMETQLLGRYMKNNLCRHGLYLVGWFNCQHWDRQDSRWKKAKGLDLASVEAELAKQAEELSKRSGARLRSFVLKAELH